MSGGQLAVVHALLDAVGPGGTVVVPTQTPGFDPERSPSQHMGAIPEQVRT
ncbi:MAG: AAC(3) family N-acetyltransferase, partial [Actinomycetes bacterium]